MLALGCLCCGAVAAFELKLQGQELTLRATDVTLQQVLERLADLGVRVKADPTIRKRASFNLDRVPADEAFTDICAPYGYALVWQVLAGPLGPMPRLEEVRVFRRDQPAAAILLQPAPAHFNITRGPDAAGPEYVADEVLLAVNPGVSAAEFNLLLYQLGGTVVDVIPALGIYRVRFPPMTNIPALLEQLRRNAIIHQAEANYAIRSPEPRRVAAAGTPAAMVQPVVTDAGSAARIAVLDSGLAMQPGLETAVVGQLDAVNPGQALGDPVGHGTQMALVANGAVAPQGQPAAGAGLPIIAVRAFDANGRATSYSVMQGVDYAVSQGARVINLSWGTETPSDFLANAVAFAQSRGVIVVAAAGNEPTGQPVYPAAYPGVLAVGALTPAGGLWDQSNYGDFVDLAAPGAATFPVGYKGPPGSYAGTSIASAYVAHALAQYLAGHPEASASEAMARLRQSLTPPAAGTAGHPYGSGSLDPAALQRLLAP